MRWKDWPIKKLDGSFFKKIYKPPKVIYYRGNINPKIFEKSLAIVGSRRMTRYGKEVIDRFIPELVTNNVTIISGFMYGVDTQAHKKTVEYGGITVAVFGSGINICYPPENDKLYTCILEKGGVVLSEYEPDSKPQLWRYPQRNRIVAGLASLGVLVIEAGEKSGSLITAEYAQKQGKKIYAVPGPITSSLSTGTNLLIKNGIAKIATEARDMIGSKNPKLKNSKLPSKPSNLNDKEKKIYTALNLEPLSADEIARNLNLDISEVSTILSLMSLRGILTESVGKFYLGKN
ncbi:DNA protecting protein DprA [Candidatus Woesebacteria bacterium RIFCSPHIGHO2_01_FULL_39_28]|uniref:DNA protecting protein DprA n=1 Tax=Candidatus Woesebacteria bacterium RIFCSPHIGHO2_01_FULL_39_28 TaxID=1802496 RepID=A0A1F7YHC2_9BACT|nr:MAG: DNA protecting protein DprA [Candidatus Woesebacteria bacterium RIFCSPHIGHO2_01_FULL_39_28]OGM58684.1 MAG: DNA protecting protein DprA [Candidatus Woesebacteria bacterium RIFCSPLOWO2_01_FULL_38_20]